jgi:Tfp pilus assembly protein PilE
MAKYFSRFPQILYGFTGNNLDSVTNLTVRFALEKKLKENTVSYFNYTIRDGDTPEILSAKLYGNPEYHWIIMMLNDIVDIENDWPLQYNAINRFIEKKYSAPEYADTSNTEVSGVVWSQQNTQSYYKVLTTTHNGNDTIKEFEIDEQSYNDLQFSQTDKTLSDGNTITVKISKKTKSYYEYENELNESKRIIKILKPAFVSGLEEELRVVFNE